MPSLTSNSTWTCRWVSPAAFARVRAIGPRGTPRTPVARSRFAQPGRGGGGPQPIEDLDRGA